MLNAAPVVVPSWLECPPDSALPPPVQTRHQQLPFEQLAWEDFERLCLRLARSVGNVEHCQLYGERGEAQHGIDLLARRSGEGYVVYQCKRQKDFGPSKITAAVDKFLQGEWFQKAETLVLCTSESLRTTQRADALDAAAQRLSASGKSLLSWDADQLSSELKVRPDIVDDFFGREWVKAFLGDEEAERLKDRLDKRDLSRLRARFTALYENVFNQHDPSSPLATGPKPLRDRFVLPDVSSFLDLTDDRPEPSTPSSARLKGDSEYDDLNRPLSPPHAPEVVEHRARLDAWLATTRRGVIIGEAGMGKSSLLRFIALDLLSATPQLGLVAKEWGPCLPVWIPFARWASLVQKDQSPSLIDFLRDWFGLWGEHDLFDLVRSAMHDKRLVLLVDGLDEWGHQIAASATLDRLRVFIQQNDIRAIMTGRRRGLEILGAPGPDWILARLCSFDRKQRELACQVWFQGAIDGDAAQRIRGFLRDVERKPELLRLAEIPLLLGLMARSWLDDATLPENRFRAYEKFIEYLLVVHPAKRQRAAQVVSERETLPQDVLEGSLACLAEGVQRSACFGGIRDDDARRPMMTFLEDQEYGLGLTRAEARQSASTILNFASDTCGLLVRKAPGEVGFFHRALQEFLAGVALSRKSKEDVHATIAQYCLDSSWHETLMSAFYAVKNPENVRQLLTVLQSASDTPSGKILRQPLIAELAFGPISLPATDARRLATEVIVEIETGGYAPLQERLLSTALSGLRNSRVKGIVEDRLRKWFPRIGLYRSHIYPKFAAWPGSDDLRQTLLLGIREERVADARSAARVLLQTFPDEHTRNQLTTLWLHGNSAAARAVAGEALAQRWPNSISESEMREASSSLAPELQLISGRMLVHRGVHTLGDMERLLELAAWRFGLDLDYRPLLAEVLVAGWPTSAKLRDACISATHPAFGTEQPEPELARSVLIEGFSDDPVATEWFVSEFNGKHLPHYDMPLWERIADKLRGNEAAARALESSIMDGRCLHYEAYWASHVAKTEQVKKRLIEHLNGHYVHWPAAALLDVWGITDSDVSRALRRFLAELSDQSAVAHLLPQIMLDQSAAFGALRSLLSKSDCDRPDFVVQGLEKLNLEKTDQLLGIVQAAYDINPNKYYLGFLIRWWAARPEIERLALAELERSDDCLSDVVAGASGSPALRSAILEKFGVLPAELRRQIAGRLRDMTSSTIGFQVLSRYRLEEDDRARTQAALSYYSSGAQTSDDTDQLAMDIVARGPTYGTIRAAAFCALFKTGRERVFIEAREDNERALLHGHSAIRLNSPFWQFVVEDWDELVRRLGDDFHERFYRDKNEFWSLVAAYAAPTSPAGEALLRFLDSPAGLALTDIRVLQFVRRARPRGDDLLRRLLGIVCRGERAHFASSDVLAAILLGQAFGGDAQVLSKMRSGANFLDVIALVALCEGWPQSSELHDAFQTIKREERFLPDPIALIVMSTKSAPDRVGRLLMGQLDHFAYADWHLRYANGFLIRRVTQDEALSNLLRTELDNLNDLSALASIPGLLASAQGLNQDLALWHREHLDIELASGSPPRVGIDIRTGRPRALVHCWLDTLMSSER